MQRSSGQRRRATRFNSVPPESHSDTVTAESLAVQVIDENQELANRYAAGDLTVLGALQEQAAKLAAGRVKEQEMKDTLLRKLGASY